jgi:SAM-dependent methyltransferase
MHFASYYRWLVYQHSFCLPPNLEQLLDIGGGDGGFVRYIPARLRVLSDLDRAVLRQASHGHPVCADGTRLPFAQVSFDLVVLSDVIEHVPADHALVAAATGYVRPGGLLWLSTTARDFQLFPPAITARAERSWGHVRKGYHPETLIEMVGPEFVCALVEWPEIALRHSYVLLWLCWQRWPALARALARRCFELDRALPGAQRERGHLYLQARRMRQPPAAVVRGLEAG